MVVVDTNVLVYAADEDSPFHVACKAWLERQRSLADAWYTTWPILYEFLRVTTHASVMRRPWSISEAWQFVAALPHLMGNVLHDAHTAILMREHGLRRICTRDTDFHRFTFLEVIDPLI